MGSVQLFIEQNAKNGCQIIRHKLLYLMQTVVLSHSRCSAS